MRAGHVRNEEKKSLFFVVTNIQNSRAMVVFSSSTTCPTHWVVLRGSHKHFSRRLGGPGTKNHPGSTVDPSLSGVLDSTHTLSI